ncbi:MAG: hypothetical protein K2Y27_19915 [Xanthobacteraceae bacterium]|nr:hypothetical protein [Xanthobacteraceae bacterium]
MQFWKSFTARIAGAAVLIVCAAVAGSGANAQTTESKPANRPATDALKLPPNYRSLIAQAVIFDYVRAGRGRPEISEQSKGGQVTNFCVRFPVPQVTIFLEPPNGTKIRSYHMMVSRGIFGQTGFTYSGADQYVDTPCTGIMKPFPELEAMAARVKTCREKTGGNCGADGFSLPNAKREFAKFYR